MQLSAQRMSVAEYMAMEERSEIRREYLDGAIFPMTDESLAHHALVGNLSFHAWKARSSRGCRVFQQGTRVHIPADNCFYYPDVVGSHDSAADADAYLVRPCFVIEVVSPTTLRTDQSEKRRKYLSIESLDEYVLVYESRMLVALYRGGPRASPVELLDKPDDVLKLTCVSVGITLNDIYASVEFSQCNS